MFFKDFVMLKYIILNINNKKVELRIVIIKRNATALKFQYF